MVFTVQEFFLFVHLFPFVADGMALVIPLGFNLVLMQFLLYILTLEKWKEPST